MAKNFEEYLQEIHMKTYIGSKDLAIEAFGQWLEDLEPEDWMHYADKFVEKIKSESIDK